MNRRLAASPKGRARLRSNHAMYERATQLKAWPAARSGSDTLGTEGLLIEQEQVPS